MTHHNDRPDAAARSMETLLTSFISTWRMDAPLPNFGTTVWSDIDINLTIDAFGHGAAMIRGIFEYIFTSTTLTFVPHAPDNITALTQKFGVRWGAYRLYISTKGFRSSGTSAHVAHCTRIQSFPVAMQLCVCVRVCVYVYVCDLNFARQYREG